jgi:hypothetical protein
MQFLSKGRYVANVVDGKVTRCTADETGEILGASIIALADGS